MCGIPIISYPVGAIAERINLFNVGWVSKSSSCEDLLSTLLEIHEDRSKLIEAKKNINSYHLVSYEKMSAVYLNEYKKAQEKDYLTNNERDNKFSSFTSQDILTAYNLVKSTSVLKDDYRFMFLNWLKSLIVMLRIKKIVAPVWRLLKKLVIKTI